MSQKQINHIINYTNKFTKDIDMNIYIILKKLMVTIVIL